MRKTTIRKSLEEAATLHGIDVVDVDNIRVHKGKRPNGGAVKLVNADLLTSSGFVRLTTVPSQLLRGTEGARERLADLIAKALTGNLTEGDAEKVREIPPHTPTATCGRRTKSGDECSRPSADGSPCWQHGGDSERQGLVAKQDGTSVRSHTPRTSTQSAPQTPSADVDWAEVAKVAAEAAAKAAVEAAMQAHATA